MPTPFIQLPSQLRGSRVLLRPYCAEDAQPVWEAVEESREHLGPWMPWAGEYRSIEDAHAFVARAQARWLLREELYLGIFALADGRFLGSSGFHDIDWRIPRFEIGYWLRQSEQAKGLISESVRVQTRFAFDQLGAQRVTIKMDPRNDRSRRVAERLGYVHEGTLRRLEMGSDGQPADRHIYALLPEEYASVAARWPDDTPPEE